MWNPNDLGHKCYGTLAGAIFIMSYLRSGSEVGVAIFDTETTDVVHSYDENELLAALCSYKGGGTDLDMKKLRKDLDEGMKRIYEYVFLLEDKRAQKAYGVHTNVSKILIINKEINPKRITLIIVEEVLGF